MNTSLGTAARCNADGVVGKEGTNVARSIQHINWAALGANLASTLLFTLLLLSPFLWGAPVWHWLLAVAISLVLGIYFYVRRERFEEPGPDADETRFPR
jgi:O-antigen/teichoic acid export membrane protein